MNSLAFSRVGTQLATASVARAGRTELRGWAAPRTQRRKGYEVLGELGRGGWGVVYKARQLSLNRLVALKMLLQGVQAGADNTSRFRTEAEAIARMQHPHIVQVYHVDELVVGTPPVRLPFFAMEFCAGGTLAQKINGAPLDPPDAVRLLHSLALAMQTAHDKQILHRDLKPANVLLAEDGTAKIGDFGLAKKLDGSGNTPSEAVVGTLSYMAPEQARGRIKQLGPACDVYALGAVLYECLSGRPPFVGENMVDMFQQVFDEEPLPLRRLNARVPRDLEIICLKCLRKEPDRRYGSARELAEDLQRLQAGEPIRARPTSSRERAAKWLRRNPLAASWASSRRIS